MLLIAVIMLGKFWSWTLKTIKKTNKHTVSDTNYNSTTVIERVKATLLPAFYFPKAVVRKVRWLF